MDTELISQQLLNSATYTPTLNWSLLLLITQLASLSIGAFFFTYLIIKLLLQLSAYRSAYSFLEVTPLRDTLQSQLSTQQLFAVMHSVCSSRSFLERMFNIKRPISLEIASTKKDGIRYLIRVSNTHVDHLKDTLKSYLPGIKITKTRKYVPNASDKSEPWISELKLAKHCALPLKTHEKLDKNDPMAYLTGAMTQLQENELIAYQIVIAPASKRFIAESRRISSLIRTKADLSEVFSQKSWPGAIGRLCTLILQVLLLPLGLLIFIATDGREGPLLQLGLKKKSTANPYKTELTKIVKQKIDQPLFQTSIRVLAYTGTTQTSKKRVKGATAALTSMSSTQHQWLKQNLKLPLQALIILKKFMFNNRIITPLSTTILSTLELADLYHFPFTKTTKTEDLQKQFSKQLPAPLTLKKSTQLDVTFAQNTYGGVTTHIGLTEDERRRHMYILGATGMGKSTLLLSMINSDLKRGKGIAVIDPHGDLTEEILNLIPEERIKDVVYFNPDDIGYPMGINLLELSKGVTGDDALREKEFVTESIISLFHKVYGEEYSGPRMEYILRNAIHTAFAVPGATLFTVNKLLINTKFRKSVLRNLDDENLKEFWKQEFARAGDYQKVNMILPITNKIGRFLFSPTAKRILEQEKSTIDFDDIMNSGKILLCNISKGKIGEDNSKVLGVVIMAKLQLAALKRARMKQSERKDFYLYVDEFQNFATEAFAQILSEARKYKLCAILAHQTTSQLEDKSLVNVTLANTGTVICFRTANPEDEKLILPQFRPFVEAGEIASLPAYSFFMRLGALSPEQPFSGKTVPVVADYDEKKLGRVVESSRKLFTKKYEIEKTSFSKNDVKSKEKYNKKSKLATTLP